MAALNDKFEILRGWDPSSADGADPSFAPRISGGNPVALTPGMIVEYRSDSTVDVSTATTTAKPVYVVVEGNTIDTDTQFVGKVLCVRGKLTVKTDKFPGAQVFAIGGAVTFTAGLLVDMAGGTQLAGFVIADNRTTDGTITVDLDL